MAKLSRDLKIKRAAIAQIVAQVSSPAVQRSAVEAASLRARNLAIADISRQVTLRPDYISQHLVVTVPKLMAGSWEASVAATKRGTLLTRFIHAPVMGPKKHPKRGKPGGQKQVGVTGSIKPGRNYTRKFFYIPLRGGNGTGIAMRTGKGRSAYKVLHGPSVYQIFQSTRTDIAPEAQAALREELEKRMKF